ncbi:MAG: hypothetical protein HY075_02070 [Deltaproteobacteria bacterium]|nr:hypothetical protein [Deltaproteobacteria bacterium]
MLKIKHAFTLAVGVVGVALSLASARADGQNFEDCVSMMNGASCTDIDPDTKLYGLCCSQFKPGQIERGKLEAELDRTRKALLDCKRTSRALKDSPCAVRGCYCGLEDSMLPPSCFDGLESCCPRAPAKSSDDLDAMKKELKNLKRELADCTKNLGKQGEPIPVEPDKPIPLKGGSLKGVDAN